MCNFMMVVCLVIGFIVCVCCWRLLVWVGWVLLVVWIWCIFLMLFVCCVLCCMLFVVCCVMVGSGYVLDGGSIWLMVMCWLFVCCDLFLMLVCVFSLMFWWFGCCRVCWVCLVWCCVVMVGRFMLKLVLWCWFVVVFFMIVSGWCRWCFMLWRVMVIFLLYCWIIRVRGLGLVNLLVVSLIFFCVICWSGCWCFVLFWLVVSS